MDEQYLQKVLAGDINAFRYFVRKYQDMAFSLAMSIVKSELIAEEAVQDAFVKAFQNIKKFKQKSKFSTWLYKIVVNESLRRVKKKRLEMVDVSDIPDSNLESEFKDSFSVLHEIEQKEIVNETLLNLPATDSLLLRLYYLEEKSIEEIKEITNLSTSNIKVVLHRARKRFYKLVEKTYKHEIHSLL